MATESVIKGAIQVSGVPENACFTNFPQLLNALGQYLTVVIPNQTFSNIIISNEQPGFADRDKIWWRLSDSGTFIGIYLFSAGTWHQVFPAPNEIFWLYGDSDNPPAGFSFTAVTTKFSAPDYTALIAMAIPAGPGPYTYYPAVYVGF